MCHGNRFQAYFNITDLIWIIYNNVNVIPCCTAFNMILFTNHYDFLFTIRKKKQNYETIYYENKKKNYEISGRKMHNCHENKKRCNFFF